MIELLLYVIKNTVIENNNKVILTHLNNTLAFLIQEANIELCPDTKFDEEKITKIIISLLKIKKYTLIFSQKNEKLNCLVYFNTYEKYINDEDYMSNSSLIWDINNYTLDKLEETCFNLSFYKYL